MDPQILVFVLLFAGIALIFAELFVPSGGLIAVLCVCCFGASVWFAYQSWYGTHSVFWWSYLAGLALLIPATFYGIWQILTKTSFGSRVLLAAPSEHEVTPHQQEQERLESLIGAQGTALSLMSPGGIALINGERLHAISEDPLIEANTPIEIIAVRGTRVIVRPSAQTPRQASENQPDAPPEDPFAPWQDNRTA